MNGKILVYIKNMELEDYMNIGLEICLIIEKLRPKNAI